MRLPGTRALSKLFGAVPVTKNQAIGIAERLGALTVLTSSLEHLSQRRELEEGGLNDWAVGRKSRQDSQALVRRALDIVGRPEVTMGIHVARIAAAGALLLPGNSRWRGGASIFLGATTALLSPRHHYGSDGSDHVATLALTSVGGARLARRRGAQDAFLWFGAMQSNLAYAISGWVKLLGPTWRDTSAITGIMRTHTYGHEKIYRFLEKRPLLAAALAYGTLAFESLFPLVYAKGGVLARPMLATAASFHVGTGYVMGLGRFATAFPSLLPLVAYTTTPRDHPAVRGRRDDAVVHLCLLLGVGAIATAVSAVNTRLKVRGGWPKSFYATTRHGNVLQYEMFRGEKEASVLVFVAGATSTAEHFAWYIDTLTRTSRNHGVITYARAGYAASTRNRTGRYTIDESADDLVDLLAEAVPDRDIVLVGHSLGAEVARRVAVRLPEQVEAVVYLDGSHPAQLARSPELKEKTAELKAHHRKTMWSVRLGGGILVSRPGWLESLPPFYRKHVFAQYRDPAMWRAGARELGAVEEEFSRPDIELPPVDAHALVISATETVENQVQADLHHELAELHRKDGHLVREHLIKTTHDRLVTDAVDAQQAVALLGEFLEQLDQNRREESRQNEEGRAQ